MSSVLNLSNEVVKLRPEVKRVKVLIIRKLIRLVSALEKKKGNQADMEKHQRRAARLHEEIRKLKVISPDIVTKAALQKDISFENVCKSKEADVSERAIARIATHPQFSKRIQSIKEAIRAFKEERINARKAEKQAKNHAEDVTLQDQPQKGIDAPAEGSEKLDDEVEEKLKIEDDKIIDKEEGCDSSQVSQKTSLEASNEPTKHPESQMSTTQDSAKQVSIPEEVIRMRKEVKRTRVLVISKLTQQVAILKKKKGEESDVKQSQELAANLIKDIQALRNLNPDQVTMTALQEKIELDKVLKDPQVSSLDRAITRIGTHSRFINKLQKVKEAIVAERTKAAEAEEKKKQRQAMVASEVIHGDDKDDDEKNEEDGDEEDDDKEEDVSDDEVGEKKLESPSIEICKSVEPTESTDSVKLPPLKEIKSASEKSRGANGKSQNAGGTASQSSPEKSLTVSSTESRLPKNITKSDKETENIIKPEKKQDPPETKKPESKKDDEESDLSDDDEEKEYFDDSTEERFHKQSSQSEESDEDDFFVGKVSKFKKKKSSQCKAGEKEGVAQKADKLQNVGKATSKAPESNLGKLQSVFCTALSKSSISQNAKHRSQPNGPRSRFQNQKGGPEGKMKPSLYKEPVSARKAAPFKHDKQTFKFAGQRQGGPSGSGRGNSQFEQHQNLRSTSGRISNAAQQSLHPSWEASRKRKEQQAQITAFQGKKIRFDDDD